MTIRAIDHINIATTKLQETRDFYVDILGLTEGDRPAFGFPGHWLYADGFPIVHVVLSTQEVEPSDRSGLNHAAFQVADLDAVVGRLKAAGLRCDVFPVPGTNFRQAFFLDPNGVRLELNESRAVNGLG